MGVPGQRAIKTISWLAAGLLTLTIFNAPAWTKPNWESLPLTPHLPETRDGGYIQVKGVALWYASFGSGSPVILLHGGLANADYWGLQVPVLMARHRVIVLDSRGHGRSARDDTPFGYDLMASDVVALMDHLHIAKAAIIGWSDGAIIGLDLAIHHPDRVTKLFAFAANSDPSGVKDVSKSPVFTQFIDRAGREYREKSPTPAGYQPFLDAITHMWASEPHFSDADLAGITVPTWIVDADHDEAIERRDTDHMASLIPGAGEMILPEVSHFAFLQDPATFNHALLTFLDRP